MTDEPVYVLCVRADSPGFVYPGSVERPCSECSLPVYLSPAGVALLYENMDAQPICGECFDTINADAQFIITRDVAREFINWMRRN